MEDNTYVCIHNQNLLLHENNHKKVFPGFFFSERQSQRNQLLTITNSFFPLNSTFDIYILHFIFKVALHL